MTIVNLYTDGACSGNQNETNIGGWGAVLEYGGHKKELYGGEITTTNNRMEMMALLSALKAMKREGLVIHVYSDSSYLMDCFRKKWYVNWQKNGWKTSQKTDVENKDLWMALLDEGKKHQVSFYRVKGHVNLDHPSTNVEGHFKKFLEWNGNDFTKQDFLYVTTMNNRADKLANIAMDEIRDKNQLL